MRLPGILLIGCLTASAAFGWGEAGHHVIGRIAGKLAGQHPAVDSSPAGRAFRKVLFDRRYQAGHVSNVPDIYWKNLEGANEKPGRLLGDSAHFLDGEFLAPGAKDPYLTGKPPLDYAAAQPYVEGKTPGVSFFQKVGTAPWRAQQFASLYRRALGSYPAAACKDLAGEAHPTRVALAFAGLLSHFTGDATMPFHTSADYDGQSTHQVGIHAYFEGDVVDALEPGLEARVETLARRLLTAPASHPLSVAAIRRKARAWYPEAGEDQEVTALMLALMGESFGELDELRRLDRTYALQKAPGRCWPASSPKAACRRDPRAYVNGHGRSCSVPSSWCRTVAQWHESFLVERLAVAAAVTADLWARIWKAAGAPSLCWTWQYAHKPSFISPTDTACFGYAPKENPEGLLHTSAKNVFECVRFN